MAALGQRRVIRVTQWTVLRATRPTQYAVLRPRRLQSWVTILGKTRCCSVCIFVEAKFTFLNTDEISWGRSDSPFGPRVYDPGVRWHTWVPQSTIAGERWLTRGSRNLRSWCGVTHVGPTIFYAGRGMTHQWVPQSTILGWGDSSWVPRFTALAAG
jgi:hypothetical protein